MAATVCSMCGDVGFPEKLFRCVRCRCRFQHSYCTNYYGKVAPAEAGAGVCDWCLSDDVQVAGKKWSAEEAAAAPGMQQQQQAMAPTGSLQESFPKGCSKTRLTGGAGGAGEQEGGQRVTKTAPVRRYKLLKDVLC